MSSTQLLDPIGTMCKLVGLNFTKQKTKIKIHNHIISLDKPDELQALFRFCGGDGKDNISELYQVIIRIIKWFLIKDNKKDNNMARIEYKLDDKVEIQDNYKVDDKDDLNNNSKLLSSCPQFIKMINYLCDALKKLQSTYKTGNVVLALQFYINILQDAVKNNFNEKLLLPECMKDTIIYHEETNNLLDYDKIKNLWDTQKIKRVCDLYDSCLQVITSNNQEDADIKDALIDGYLRSIDAILTVTDKEFQKLIHNSNKG